MKAEKKNYFWVTVANVLACFAVVVLHVNIDFWKYSDSPLWQLRNIIQASFYWGVPIFFMLSGATLLNYRDRYPTKVFIKKRFMKTVIPFIIWSAVAFVWRVFIVSDMHYLGFRDLISNIFNANYNSNYWFFIALFAIYLSMPLLSAVRKDIKIKVFTYISLVGFLTISLLPTLFSLLNIEYNDDFKLPVTCGYIILALLGYIIAHSNISRKVRYLFYGASIIGWLIRIIGISVLSKIDGEVNTVFDGYINFPSILQAIGIMIFIKHVPWKRFFKRNKSSIQKIAANTFGIYLMHYFIINDIHFRSFYNDISVPLHILEPFLIFGFCYCISRIISKIPILKISVGA